MSGFDENPFGEPVFDDPFKVSEPRNNNFHIFQFFLSYRCKLMIHLRLGRIDSTSSSQYCKQQSKFRRLRSIFIAKQPGSNNATSNSSD